MVILVESGWSASELEIAAIGHLFMCEADGLDAPRLPD